ncbi:YkyA family protein [Macrococcoides goetzii]|nr:YkyA family protein [Macrococcus goetzii]
MKYLKGMILVCLVVILTACTDKTANLEAFYQKIDEANTKEQQIVGVSEKLEKLENNKLQLFNKVDKAKSGEMTGLADQLIKNTSERKAIAKKEAEIMLKSKEIFEKSKIDAKAIEDKTQKQQVEKLVSDLDEKYAKHSNLMISYQKILDKENELFNYLKEETLDKNVVNEKITVISKLYKQFQTKTDDYTKITRLVEQNKKPIVETLNKN